MNDVCCTRRLLSKLGAMAIYLQIVDNHLFHFHFGLMHWLFVINEMRMAHERLESNLAFKKTNTFTRIRSHRHWSPYRSRFDCFHAMPSVMRCFVSLFVSIRLIKYHFVSFFVVRFKAEIRVLPFLCGFFFFKKLVFHRSFFHFLHRRWFQMQFYWGISILFSSFAYDNFFFFLLFLEKKAENSSFINT